MTNSPSRRDLLRSAAAAAGLGAASRAAAQDQPRPNILLVLSDDHSAPHLGCYGNSDIRTPNLDPFAAEGMRFDRAYMACPQCVPSRAAIMTGRSPVAIQMTRFSAPLPMDVRTYPELLRAQGYYTAWAVAPITWTARCAATSRARCSTSTTCAPFRVASTG